jgi:hypothetical protein
LNLLTVFSWLYYPLIVLLRLWPPAILAVWSIFPFWYSKPPVLHLALFACFFSISSLLTTCRKFWLVWCRGLNMDFFHFSGVKVSYCFWLLYLRWLSRSINLFCSSFSFWRLIIASALLKDNWSFPVYAHPIDFIARSFGTGIEPKT